jgi:hypothetical protein
LYNACTSQSGRQAQSWDQGATNWVGTRAPITNTPVPSAPKCVGLLADLSVMPPQESEHTVAPIPILKICFHLQHPANPTPATPAGATKLLLLPQLSHAPQRHPGWNCREQYASSSCSANSLSATAAAPSANPATPSSRSMCTNWLQFTSTPAQTHRKRNSVRHTACHAGLKV